MANRIQFTSAVLHSFSRNGKGGSATFSSSLTRDVCRAMDWPTDYSIDWLTKARPDGDLHATTAELVPNEKGLKKQAKNLDVSRVNGFEVIRLELESSRGKGHRLELRFTVSFPDLEGCRKLEEYMAVVGEGKSTLNVSYTKQQSLIPDEVTASDEQRAAVTEE